MTARIGLFTSKSLTVAILSGRWRHVLVGQFQPVAEHRGLRGVGRLREPGLQFKFDRPSALAGIGRRTVAKTVSGLIMLALHPGPDVRGTIAKDNTSSSFALSQETDGVTIGEDQIRKIQDKDATSWLGVDQLA